MSKRKENLDKLEAGIELVSAISDNPKEVKAIMTTLFDFSHLYNTETVSVTDAHGTELFTAVVKQISNGEKTDAQAMMMADIDIPTSGSKRSRERALQSELKRAMQSGVTSRISLYEEVAAIDSWSLKDASGEPVPVTVEAWRALPAFISSQIADAIERLNPELDEDFRGDDRD